MQISLQSEVSMIHVRDMMSIYQKTTKVWMEMEEKMHSSTRIQYEVHMSFLAFEVVFTLEVGKFGCYSK